MTATAAPSTRYPLLEEILTLKNISMQAMYTVGDVAKIFGVSTKTIQNQVANSRLKSRNLPGHAKFLNRDIEDYLDSSRRPKR